jgi:hypothetical protein
MAKYLTRACPDCGDFFGVILGAPAPETSVSAIRGACLRCGYRIDWKLILGSAVRRKRHSPSRMQPIDDL